MDYKSDPIKYKPTIATTDVKDTKMLKGEGAFTAAQNEQNETIPWKTGKAKSVGGLGGQIKH